MRKGLEKRAHRGSEAGERVGLGGAALLIAVAIGMSAGPSGPADAQDTPPEPQRRVNVAILANAPPFSFVSRFGYRTGFEFELARALCDDVPVECNFVPMGAEEVVPALASRRVDLAIARVSITSQLDNSLAFSEPYFRPSARYVIGVERVGDAVPIEGGDLVRAAVAGTPHADYLSADPGARSAPPTESASPEEGPFVDPSDAAAVRPSGPRVRIYADAEAMWIDLALDRVHAVLTDVTAAREAFLSTPVGENYRFAPIAVSDPEIYGQGLGIAVRDGVEELLNPFNEALERFRATEDFATLTARYLDGDMLSDNQ